MGLQFKKNDEGTPSIDMDVSHIKNEKAKWYIYNVNYV